MAEELTQIGRIERALDRGDPARALELLAALERRFPITRLREERRALGVLCHCRQGTATCSEEVAAFLGAYPNSVYAPRMRALHD